MKKMISVVAVVITGALLASCGTPANAAADQTMQKVFDCENPNTLYRRIKALKKEKDPAYLLGCLYHYGKHSDPSYEIMREILWALPKSLLPAFFVVRWSKEDQNSPKHHLWYFGLSCFPGISLLHTASGLRGALS